VKQFAEDIERHCKNPAGARARRHGALSRGKNSCAANGSLCWHRPPSRLSMVGGILVSSYEARRAEQRFQECTNWRGRSCSNSTTDPQTFPLHPKHEPMIVKKAQEYLDHLAKTRQRRVALQSICGEAYRKLWRGAGRCPLAQPGQHSAAMENYGKAGGDPAPARGARAAPIRRFQRNLR